MLHGALGYLFNLRHCCEPAEAKTRMIMGPVDPKLAIYVQPSWGR